MKKLMIAAAIVCAAAMSHAATVKWDAANIKTPGEGGKYTTTNTGKGTVNGFLYNITASQYSTWLTALNTTDWAAQQAAMLSIYDAVKDGTAIATGSNSANTKGNVSIIDTRDVSTATVEKPIDLYSAIIYTYNDGKDNFVLANVGTQHYEANVGNSLGNINKFVGGGSSGTAIQGWAAAAVPEPTSGLLLLLGVAGLALRRRHA